MSDTDSPADGREELSGEELGVGGDAGIHVHHLLRQDGHPDPEPHDCGPRLVRPEDLGSGH